MAVKPDKDGNCPVGLFSIVTAPNGSRMCLTADQAKMFDANLKQAVSEGNNASALKIPPVSTTIQPGTVVQSFWGKLSKPMKFGVVGGGLVAAYFIYRHFRGGRSAGGSKS